MTKRRFIFFGATFLLMLMSIGLTISTLHSHHNLEFHSSSDYANTGQCLTADTTLCPICGHLVQASQAPSVDGHTYLQPEALVENRDAPDFAQRNYIPVLGRSPPIA